MYESDTSKIDNLDEWERFVVDPAKQSFRYPDFDEPKNKIDIDEMWKDEQVTAVIKEMFSEFTHLFVQLTPLQQHIVSILVINPDIQFSKLCKLSGKKKSWVHLLLKAICAYPQFHCLMPRLACKKLTSAAK